MNDRERAEAIAGYSGFYLSEPEKDRLTDRIEASYAAVRAETVKALEPWLRHYSWCDKADAVIRPCSCGLVDKLKELRGEHD